MSARKRLALALVIMLSGFLLVPFVALPKESFRWQLFAGAYGGGPALGSNHSTGAPRSHFLISGFGFKAGASLVLKANGATIATVVADSNGAFRILLSTSEDQGLGRYVITAEEGSSGRLAGDVALAAVTIRVMDNVPVRAKVEGVTQQALPNVPAAFSPGTWLPVVAR